MKRANREDEEKDANDMMKREKKREGGSIWDGERRNGRGCGLGWTRQEERGKKGKNRGMSDPRQAAKQPSD